jgi:hypothetical protein
MHAGAAGELADRFLLAAEDLGDLGIRHTECLAQHEHGAFQWRERLQHHEHRHRDRLGECNVLGDVGSCEHGLG